jgi:hypothetical protein
MSGINRAVSFGCPPAARRRIRLIRSPARVSRAGAGCTLCNFQSPSEKIARAHPLGGTDLAVPFALRETDARGMESALRSDGALGVSNRPTGENGDGNDQEGGGSENRAARDPPGPTRRAPRAPTGQKAPQGLDVRRRSLAADRRQLAPALVGAEARRASRTLGSTATRGDDITPLFVSTMRRLASTATRRANFLVRDAEPGLWDAPHAPRPGTPFPGRWTAKGGISCRAPGLRS